MDFFYRVSHEHSAHEPYDELDCFRDSELSLAEEFAKWRASIPGWGNIVIEKVFFRQPGKTEEIRKIPQEQWKYLTDQKY